MRKETYWGKDYSNEDLKKILDQKIRKAERQLNKIGESDDWLLERLPAYQMFKEFSKASDGKDRVLDFDKLIYRGVDMALSRLGLLQALNKMDTLLNMKSATLTGAKEIIKNRKNAFINRNIDSVTKKYMEDYGLSHEKAENKAYYFLRKMTKSEEFYDFLHSAEYEKLTQKYGLDSGDLIRDYYFRTVDMLTKYSELEETQENVSDYYGDYLSRVEDPRTKQKFYMSDVLTKETIWYDEE
ncbi:MAG: hypothetical protein J6S85_22350 [Methanobrevibacter sp.]|nr:hypothetical protein [Methanobrevibacter sp.]